MAAQLISLHSAEASLVLECCTSAAPLWRHLGALVDVGELAALADGRIAASFSLDDDVPLSTAPPAGLGWFGSPMLAFSRAGQACVPLFDGAEVSQSGSSITISLHDSQAGLHLEQQITLASGGAFLFDARLENTGTAPVTLDWLASLQLPLSASSGALIAWRGRHNAELQECREPMPAHSWQRETRRGISGHGGPPGVVVLGEGGTRDAGLVHALQLAWSGDSRIAVEREDEGSWVLSAGAVLAPAPGSPQQLGSLLF